MDGRVFYAVGDVHGQADLLADLHARILRHAGDRKACIIHLGDLVDRGPDSRSVIDAVIALQVAAPSNIEVLALRGNHEQMMLDALDAPGTRAEKWWLFNGGRETLQSYGVAEDPLPANWADAIPAAHIDFMRALPTRLTIDTRRLVFVHAGIDPDVFPNCAPAINLWTRSEHFLRSRSWPERSELEDLIVVHGHTAQRIPVPEIEPRRINVDTGAGLGGPLTTAVLTPGEEAEFLQAYPPARSHRNR
jgi:serine/threonine protein phosphatase 1